MPPELFLGFEISEDGAKIATAEKALFDTLYLAPARSRPFARLPEIEFPRKFRWADVGKHVDHVKSGGRRVFLARRIDALRTGRHR